MLPSLRTLARPIATAGPSRLTSRFVVSLSRPYSTPPSEAAQTGQGEQRIHRKLSERFKGQQLQVQDVSGGCGSFYAILISSPEFKGLSTIKQHKLVNECLKEEIAGIHGLQLKTIPEE